ncbi:MAG: thioredoxin family protein [Tepidisphaeraceae bacterium]
MIKGWYYRSRGDTGASKVAWQTDFDAALGRARESGKSLLVDFTATWCPPCQVMKHEVWSDDRVAAAANRAYVPVLIDVDANADIARRYGIQTIPSILVVDGSGQMQRSTTFVDADGMLAFLK